MKIGQGVLQDNDYWTKLNHSKHNKYHYFFMHTLQSKEKNIVDGQIIEIDVTKTGQINKKSQV